jgi:hypothetical protein
MWKWPQTQFLFAGCPQLGKAMRLDNQKPNDQSTKDHELCMGCGGG